MITYITAFIFYTLAMIGILLIGFVIYKNTMMVKKSETRGSIKILDSLPVGNKKTLLIVKIKNEKFLIASGLEHTTFLAKLNDDNQKTTNQNPQKEEVISRNELKKILNEENNANMMTKENQMNVNFFNKPKKEEYIDFEKMRLQKLQKQFNELYEKTAPTLDENVKDKAILRKAMIKQLLSDLNDTPIKNRSNY